MAIAAMYGDRRHVLISGTASINNKGEIKYPKNIVKQTERMWANIEALLEEADCTYQDVCQMIVYLRDNSDYLLVKRRCSTCDSGASPMSSFRPPSVVQAGSSRWNVWPSRKSANPLLLHSNIYNHHA